MEPSSNANIYDGFMPSSSSAISKPERSLSQVQPLHGSAASAFVFNNEVQSTASLKNRVRLLTVFQQTPLDSAFHEEFRDVLKAYMTLAHEQKDEMGIPLAELCVTHSAVIKAEQLLKPLMVGDWDSDTFHMLLEITNKFIEDKAFARNTEFRSFLSSNWLVVTPKASSPEMERIYKDLLRAVKNYQVYIRILAEVQPEDYAISPARVEASLLLFSAVWIRLRKKLEKSKLSVKPTVDELQSLTSTFNQIRRSFRDRTQDGPVQDPSENVWVKWKQSINLYPAKNTDISVRVRSRMVFERLLRKLHEQGVDPDREGAYLVNTNQLYERLKPFLSLPLVNPVDLILEKSVSSATLPEEGFDLLPSGLRQLQTNLEKLLDEIAQDGLQVVELDDSN